MKDGLKIDVTGVPGTNVIPTDANHLADEIRGIFTKARKAGWDITGDCTFNYQGKALNLLSPVGVAA